MRGNPMWILAWMTGLFVLGSWPVWQLTNPVVSLSVPTTLRAVGEEKTAWLTLRWAHTPESLKLKDGDKVIWERTGTESSPVETELALSIVEQQVDWRVEAVWPTGTPDTGLTVTIEPDGLHARTVTLWSRGNFVDEVVHFTWNHT